MFVHILNVFSTINISYSFILAFEIIFFMKKRLALQIMDPGDPAGSTVPLFSLSRSQRKPDRSKLDIVTETIR